MLACLCKKQRSHTHAVVFVRTGSKHNVDGATLAYTRHAHGSVVAGFAAVQFVDFFNQHGCKIFRAVTRVGKRRKKFGNVAQFPTEVVHQSRACVRTTVAHGNYYVVLFEVDGTAVNLFALYLQQRFVVFDVLPLAQQQYRRVVVLYYFNSFVVFKVQNGKCGIRYTTYRAHGQRRSNRLDAFLDAESLGNKRRDDF